MSNNQADEHEDAEIHRTTSEEIPGSPASHSNSSSSARRRRIVELLHSDNQSQADNQEGDLDWVIGDEFYDEDVAEDSNHLSSDDEAGDGIDDDDEDQEILEREGFIDFYDVDEFREPDLEGHDYDESATETEESEEEDAADNYDTLLPVGHQYLGENLEESRGRCVFDENSTVNLLSFNFRYIVLFPGQTLPLTISNQNDHRVHHYLLECVRSGTTTIGMMSDPSTNRIGTTAEIRNFSIEDGELKLILEGRQRFSLVGEPFEIVKRVDVKILPEVSLGLPYPRSSSMARFYSIVDLPSKFIISKHPPWLLKIYAARNIMKRILEQIKDWCSADLSKDPNDFSYWVASNLPVSNTERMKALSFTCAEARLLWLLEMLKKSENFACCVCKNVICQKSDVFPMSRSGPQCSFVNPSGFIHDTITVRKAAGLVQAYNWSTEYSWFPGYSWRMALCSGCNQHIGWCYRSIEPETKPKRFFGLSRMNVSLHK